MAKHSYEMIDPRTGEVTVVETVIDIGPLKAYNEWVIENKLNPPRFEPEDYARHLEGVKLRESVDEVLAYIDTYEPVPGWPSDMPLHIKKMLTDEE